MGYEAAYAGTSFATFDQLGTLAYGSPVMHVTGDRTVEHGLATVGIDDEGVAGQSFDLVRDGDAGRLSARPLHRGRHGLRALERVRVRRLADARADPAHGQRVAGPRRRGRPEHRGPHRRRRPRHLHRRRQELVDRHAALQLPVHRAALLPHRERASWPGRSRTSPTRRPRPTSGAPWKRSGARRPGCSAGPSTAARASPARWRRSPTAARRCSCAACNVLNARAESGR